MLSTVDVDSAGSEGTPYPDEVVDLKAGFVSEKELAGAAPDE